MASKEYYRNNAGEINRQRRERWQEIKDSVNAKRRKRFRENKEFLAHIILNGKTKQIRLDREKSKICDICRRKIEKRNAHHFSYEQPSRDWITVCTACHTIIHMAMWNKKYSGVFNSIDEWYDAYEKTIAGVRRGYA